MKNYSPFDNGDVKLKSFIALNPKAAPKWEKPSERVINQLCLN